MFKSFPARGSSEGKAHSVPAGIATRKQCCCPEVCGANVTASPPCAAREPTTSRSDAVAPGFIYRAHRDRPSRCRTFSAVPRDAFIAPMHGTSMCLRSARRPSRGSARGRRPCGAPSRGLAEGFRLTRPTRQHDVRAQIQPRIFASCTRSRPARAACAVRPPPLLSPRPTWSLGLLLHSLPLRDGV